MGQNIYKQSVYGPHPLTMTVRQLRAALENYPEHAPVLFKSPQNGAYGPHTEYTIDRIDLVRLPREENKIDGHSYTDEDTGRTVVVDSEVEVRLEWTGVVIS